MIVKKEIIKTFCKKKSFSVLTDVKKNIACECELNF